MIAATDRATGAAAPPRTTPRERARRDDPGHVLASADLEAWERSDGVALEAAAAIRRTDLERFIPGLPARRTFKVLGWVTLVAFGLDSALAWLSPADWIDALDMGLQYGTAGLGVAIAGWSILSEIRGWEGSDAATWFLKGRVDRFRKKIEPRRAVLCDTVIAVGENRLVVYRDEGGTIRQETLAPDAIIGLSLETSQSHMTLQLTTRGSTRRFAWLPRDAAFEAAVAALAGTVGASQGATTITTPGG